METWHPLPYLVTQDDLLAIIQQWSAEWMTPTIEDTKAMGGTAQHAGPSGTDKGKEVEEPEPEIEHDTQDPLNKVDPT